MSKAIENAFEKMEAQWAFKAELDNRCAADAVYSNAKRIADQNAPSATSFDTLVGNIAGGRSLRRVQAIKAMGKRRAQISIEMKSHKAEAA